MSNIQQTILTRILTSRVALVAGCFLLVGIIVSAARIGYTNFSTNRDISVLKKELEDLEANHQRLEQLQSFLSTDFFAEKEARVKLGMQKEGEQVVVIQNTGVQSEGTQHESPQKQALSHTPEHERAKNPTAWWTYFFGVQY